MIIYDLMIEIKLPQRHPTLPLVWGFYHVFGLWVTKGHHGRNLQVMLKVAPVGTPETMTCLLMGIMRMT